MRLICPNCSAQYEIPDDVMPPEGRDVQCSSCGQTWFQDHPDTIARREAEQAAAPHDDEEVVKVEAGTEPPANPEPDADLDVPTFEPEREPEPEADRRRLDPDVTDVLREEAERETLARKEEAAAFESQPDLGLPDTGKDNEKQAREAQERMARLRGETPQPAKDGGEEVSVGLGSRRDLLPDIEEINSTLRSNSSRSPDADPGQTAQIEVQEKRSSRRGFILTVALVAVMALVYSYAPQIAQTVPSAEPALAGYVAMIDGWRIWMDDQISSLLTWLDAAAVSSAQ